MNKIKINYLFNLLLTLVSLIFPILSFPYAAKILGPIGIGKIQFIISFAQYFALFAALGIPIYGIREIAKIHHDKEMLNKTFSELFVIYFLTSIFIGFLYFILIITVPKFCLDFRFYLYALSIILLGFSSFDWFYSGLEEFKIIALRSVVIKLLSLFFLFFFVKSPNDLFAYFLVSIFSIIGNNLISGLLIWNKVELSFSNLNFRRHINPLFYIFGATLASSIYTLLDVILLGFLADEKAVGYYTAGIKLSKFSIPFVTSLGTILIPQISQSLKIKDLERFYSLLDRSFNFIVLLGVPISFGLFLLSKESLQIFSGEKFLPGVMVMQILSFLPFVIGLGYFFGVQILIPAGLEKELLISVSIGMVLSVCLNFLLIPFLREKGAAWANLISEIAVTTSYIFFVKKSFIFNIKDKSQKIFNAFISCLVFYPITIISKWFIPEIFVEIMVISFFCATFYFTSQAFIFKEVLSLEIIKNLLIIPKKIKNALWPSNSL